MRPNHLAARLRSSLPVRADSARATNRHRRSSGRPTAPISPAHAIRRSIKSTGRISRSCRSPGGSNDPFGPRPDTLYSSTPLVVGNVLYTTAGTRGRSSRSTPPPARSSGCTPRTRGRVARTRPGAGRDGASGTGRAPMDPISASLCHTRLPDDRPQCQDRPPDTGFRQGRRRRLKQENDQELDPVTADLGLKPRRSSRATWSSSGPPNGSAVRPGP